MSVTFCENLKSSYNEADQRLLLLTNTDIIELLTARDKNGITALSVACANEDIPVITALSNVIHSLADAGKLTNTDIVKLLEAKHRNGTLALSAAITNNHTEVIAAFSKMLYELVTAEKISKIQATALVKEPGYHQSVCSIL